MNGQHTAKKKRSKCKPHIFIDQDDGQWCCVWGVIEGFNDRVGVFVTNLEVLRNAQAAK